MRGQLVAADQGQALVIVGLAMVVLIGALGLVLDLGYGYVMRRALQADTDAATLAASRHVASTYRTISGAPVFEATSEEICAGVTTRTTRPATTVEVAFIPETGGSDRSTWTTITTSDCAAGAGQRVPASTRFVRVQASATYRPLFAVATGQRLTVGASSRARLTAGASIRQLRLPPGQSYVPGVGVSGATTAPNAAIWPIALNFRAAEYAMTGSRNTPCGQYCGDSERLVTLWSGDSDPKQHYGSFGQLVSFAHNSLRDFRPDDPAAAPVHQVITETDYRGTSDGSQGHPLTPPLPNRSDPAQCGGAQWNTAGAATQDEAIRCDLPNWFYYGFGGSIGVGTDWGDSGWTAYRGGAERPSALPTRRSSCAEAPAWLPTPSCSGGSETRVGDWVETINPPGVGDRLSRNMALRMKEFIDRYGRETPNGLGKAVVVRVLLWDCAETYVSPGRWRLLLRGGDGDGEVEDQCAKVKAARGSRTVPVDRVHVFAVVPFTFYDGLITISGGLATVKAYWGDTFGDAGNCARDPSAAACALNPLMNSAFLVADD